MGEPERPDVNEPKFSASYLAMQAANKYAEVKGAASRLDALRQQLEEIESELREAMTIQAVSQVQVETEEGKTTVFLRNAFYANVSSEEKSALLAWLKQNGQGDIVKEDVNTATLRKHCRELEESGLEMPPMVKTYHAQEVGYRRS